jgi:putative ATPase
MDLPFADTNNSSFKKPLAERMRPATLEEFYGQENIVGKDTLLCRALVNGELPQSMILWGPPGCGKTTLARLIAHSVKSRFITFSAVTSGIGDVKRVISDGKKLRKVDDRPLLLFVDEIHRFNKAQQDAFLPHIEDGTIVLVGATTENPSFEVIGPLLSRSRVFVLDELEPDHIRAIMKRALEAPNGLRGEFEVENGVLAFVADQANGDARVALNALEYAASIFAGDGKQKILSRELMADALQRRNVTTDKNGESHFNLISAIHKSMRGGDADASLYWLARMCEAGEDPMYIARRLVRFASEDVGLADPNALAQAVAAKDAVAFVGYPECKLALAQCVVYLSLAPKSNSLYAAYGEVSQAVASSPQYPVPMHIRNAPTRLMKDLGYGKGYKYPHDYQDNFADQEFLPEQLADKRFYFPKSSGFETELKARLADFLSRKKNRKR